MSSPKRQIVIEQTIARGGHSVVHAGRDNVSLERLAIKEIDLSKDGAYTLYKTEVKAMKQLPPHRNLPRLIGHCRSQESASIVMSYYPFPSLQTYIQTHGPMPDSEALYVLRQVIEVIDVLAVNGLAHRDIKSDNILINPTTLQIRLIDFGLANIRSEEIGESSVDNQYIGTPLYMAPDVIKSWGFYNILASELWSSGILLWEMLLGHHPYREVATKNDLMKLHRKQKDFAEFSVPVQVVLSGLLAFDEKERSSLSDTIAYLQKVTRVPSSRCLPFNGVRSKSLDASSGHSSKNSATSSTFNTPESSRDGN